jgi:hypothetical protein
MASVPPRSTGDHHDHDHPAIENQLVPIPFHLDEHIHSATARDQVDIERLFKEPFGSVFRSFTSLTSVVSLVELFTRRQRMPWAILVVTFNDDPAPSSSLVKYEAVFTAAGTGTLNMVDYFDEMSHGLVDVSGSKVFGPFVLNHPRADYVGNVYPQPAGKLNRDGVLDFAKAAAVAAGVDLSQFSGVVVCGTPLLDLCGWVGGFAALCDDDSLQPSLLGQEMGHGFGLDHSRLNGSLDDYQDTFDTMSTANAYMATHPDYGAIGPGLNAANMRMRGWLNESRVRAIPATSFADEVVTLRPLHARHLSGALAIQVGQFLIELRLRKRWDAGIPRSCILVHRAQSNVSYLMQGSTGTDLVGGSQFEFGRPTGFFGDYVRVFVESIDEQAESARVHVTYHPFALPDIPILVDRQFPRIPLEEREGVIMGKRGLLTPSDGPTRQLLESVARLLDTDDSRGRPGHTESRMRALAEILQAVGDVARTTEVVTHTPPGLDRLRRER